MAGNVPVSSKTGAARDFEEHDLSVIGQHCVVAHCRQLDFLPFRCALCKVVTCTEHREHHGCTVARPSKEFIPCDKCKQLVLAPHLLDEHVRSGCKLHVRETPKKSNTCGRTGCKERLLTPFNCRRCHRGYCVRHRSEQDHTCGGHPLLAAMAMA